MDTLSQARERANPIPVAFPPKLTTLRFATTLAAMPDPAQVNARIAELMEQDRF